MTDPLEKIIRPIVEGQVRGFVKEHPSILSGVDWFKNGQKPENTFVGSVSKRIIGDLLSAHTRRRLEAALLGQS